MPTPMPGAASSEAYIAYGEETVQGTPVAWTTRLEAGPAGNTAEFNPDRRPVKIMNGSANSTIAYVDLAGNLRVIVDQWYAPTTMASWLASCGLVAGGIIPPKPLTIWEVYGSVDCKKYPGCRATKITLRGSYNQITQCITELLGTVKPVTAAVPTYVGPTSETPWTHSQWLTPTLIGATANIECEDWELVIDFTLAEFYGGGQPLPTRNVRTNNMVTGKITPLHAVAEYAAFRDGTAGTIVFVLSDGVKTHTFTVTHCKYLTGPIATPENKYITLPLTFGSFSPDTSDMLGVTYV